MNKIFTAVMLVVMFSVSSAFALNPANLTALYQTAPSRDFYKIAVGGNGTKQIFAGLPVGETAAISIYDIQNEVGTYKLTELKLIKSLTPNLDVTINSDSVGNAINDSVGVDARLDKHFALGIVVPMAADTATIQLGSRVKYGIFTGFLTISAQGQNPIYGLTANKSGVTIDLAYMPNGSISWLRLAKNIKTKSFVLIPGVRVQTSPGCGGEWLGIEFAVIPQYQ